MAGAHCSAFSVLTSLTNTTPKLLKPLLSSSISKPVIPIVFPPQNDTFSEPQLDELVGVVAAVDEVEEIQVTETEGVAGDYSGNKNVVDLDETELEYKINEIRAMAREVRKIEGKARGADNEKGMKDNSTYEKKKSGIASANHDSMGVGNTDKRLFLFYSVIVNDQKENLVDCINGTGLEKSQRGPLVEVMKFRETKDIEALKLQNLAKGKQETTMKFDKDSRWGGNGSSANMVSSDLSDIKSDLWWLKLPYVLAILMRRGLDHEGPGGLFTLRLTSQMQHQSEISYTVAFEDRDDANNFCCLLESFFEDLGDFSADIVPLSVKELHDEVKSGMKNIVVVKKRQLKLYAGQPLADVEKALFSLIEQDSTTIY
ncbi:hypothetical protein Patl1_25061 [Pistacia atlantica]|uniref:Uncharacterized protein n=1 Tax=Pistacia atlantica TaxID=434234 RepID=A0ACC1B3F3_9ROSI|nr:hypothetical protein Patl1_25061 [Pistacia atlantica]